MTVFHNLVAIIKFYYIRYAFFEVIYLLIMNRDLYSSVYNVTLCQDGYYTREINVLKYLNDTRDYIDIRNYYKGLPLRHGICLHVNEFNWFISALNKKENKKYNPFRNGGRHMYTNEINDTLYLTLIPKEGTSRVYHIYDDEIPIILRHSEIIDLKVNHLPPSDDDFEPYKFTVVDVNKIIGRYERLKKTLKPRHQQTTP